MTAKVIVPIHTSDLHHTPISHTQWLAYLSCIHPSHTVTYLHSSLLHTSCTQGKLSELALTYTLKINVSIFYWYSTAVAVHMDRMTSKSSINSKTCLRIVMSTLSHVFCLLSIWYLVYFMNTYFVCYSSLFLFHNRRAGIGVQLLLHLSLLDHTHWSHHSQMHTHCDSPRTHTVTFSFTRPLTHGELPHPALLQWYEWNDKHSH